MKIRALAISAFLFTGVAAGAQSINDAQIAHIVVTANQVDIDAGELASKMATHPEVKKFGATMVTDHTGVNKAAVDLATRLKVRPEDNPTSQAMFQATVSQPSHGVIKPLRASASPMMA